MKKYVYVFNKMENVYIGIIKDIEIWNIVNR